MKKLFEIQPIRLGLFAGTLAFLFGCTPQENFSRIIISLTDSPADYEQVNIDVVSVDVNTEEEGWQTLASINPGIYDLLTLTNGISDVLGNGQIPSGTLTQIRLVLGTNNSVVVGGVSYELKVPSGQTSGIKLNVHQVLDPLMTYNFLLDFDAALSVVPKGGGGYNFKPVIRVLTDAVTSGLRGALTPLAGAGPVFAIIGGDTVSTFPDAAGLFAIGGLAPGTYSVVVDATDPYLDQTISGVVVNLNAITNLGTITLQQ